MELRRQTDIYARKRQGECCGFVGKKSNNLSWMCNTKHRWYAPLELMREQHSWCPHCPNKRERICRYILEDLTGKSFPLARSSFLDGLHLDGYCRELNLAFEHNGR
ncbi:hypothetical protein RclHR1_06520011 [Rhizophagus clarus]|uniref:Zinc-ribbon domain-containing protein n=1 Tax=Rhizophagus clarus TaxID=94130 RepID=A0A2Z6S523_9GLOM|nr:hypothetical protein RclHR1_06520011 [Rhizophagus clarus]GES87490.1 hypothetical protein GLOIN_2v1791139 [Rhizophagus clarus]